MNPILSIRVMLVDDHYMVRMGLRSIIDSEASMSVVAEAEDGSQALIQYRRCQPDVTLMDLRMPHLDGVEATRLIRQEFPLARIIMLTTYHGDHDIHRALEAGACGYVLKNVTGDKLVDAIHTVHRGRRHISEDIAVQLAGATPRAELTPREHEVLQNVVQGSSNKEIADKLGVTEHTVKSHLKSILAKLGVRDRTEAATSAIQRGIIRLD
jgi:DNA-binding NarL/FixJ family response regulator